MRISKNLLKGIDDNIRSYFKLGASLLLDPAAPEINGNGDRCLAAGPYGPDISLQRMDHLDAACALFVAGSDAPPQALDIGCGIGAQSLRMAELGAEVVANDIIDQGQARLFEKRRGGNPSFIRGDIRELSAFFESAQIKFDIVYSQRMWSSIPYGDASELLAKLNGNSICRKDAVFFISAIGLNSEIGRGYLDSGKPVERRFSPYAPAMALKHGVSGSECLYTKDELIAQARKARLEIIDAWESDFGNPKLVAIRPGAKAKRIARLHGAVWQARQDFG